jgi:hypothetical protein
VKRLGVGETVSAFAYTADHAVPRLRRLLSSPTVARACNAVKSRFEGVDAIGQTCDLIETLDPAASRSTPIAPAA